MQVNQAEHFSHKYLSGLNQYKYSLLCIAPFSPLTFFQSQRSRKLFRPRDFQLKWNHFLIDYRLKIIASKYVLASICRALMISNNMQRLKFDLQEEADDKNKTRMNYLWSSHGADEAETSRLYFQERYRKIYRVSANKTIPSYVYVYVYVYVYMYMQA